MNYYVFQSSTAGSSQHILVSSLASAYSIIRSSEPLIHPLATDGPCPKILLALLASQSADDEWVEIPSMCGMGCKGSSEGSYVEGRLWTVQGSVRCEFLQARRGWPHHPWLARRSIRRSFLRSALESKSKDGFSDPKSYHCRKKRWMVVATLALGFVQFGIANDLEAVNHLFTVIVVGSLARLMILTFDTHENPEFCMSPCSFEDGGETDIAETDLQAVKKPTANRLPKSTSKYSEFYVDAPFAQKISIQEMVDGYANVGRIGSRFQFGRGVLYYEYIASSCTEQHCDQQIKKSKLACLTGLQMRTTSTNQCPDKYYRIIETQTTTVLMFLGLQAEENPS
ncbi:hypothetical protein ACLOJK_007379 [Asimina triloba]